MTFYERFWEPVKYDCGEFRWRYRHKHHKFTVMVEQWQVVISKYSPERGKLVRVTR